MNSRNNATGPSSDHIHYSGLSLCISVFIRRLETVVRRIDPMIKNTASANTLYRILPVIELTNPKIKVPETIAILDNTSIKLKKVVGSSLLPSKSLA